MDDETIVLETRSHAATLVKPFVTAVFGVTLALLVGMLVTPRGGRDLVDSVVGVIAAIFLLRLLWRVLQWRAAKTVVTERRLFQVSGVLSRKVSSMPLARMTDLTYRRPILGRLLGYGDIAIESAGTELGVHKLRYLPHPDRFYRTITRLVSEVTHGPLDPYGQEVPNWDEEDTGPLPRVVV